MNCKHCGLEMLSVDRPWEQEGFCCAGCRAVFNLIEQGGLQRFYALGGGRGVPVGSVDAPPSRPWLDAVAGSGTSLDIDIQGVHCAGCVWLLDELFARHGKGRFDLNPTLGRASLRVDDDYDVHAFVDDVESFGYRVAPAGAAPEPDGMLLRVGLCLTLAMNGSIFAVATYLGLREGPVFHLLHQLSYGAAVLAVWVGGSVFIRAAYHGLRRGLIHLDLPIALGVVLSFAGASAAFFRTGEAQYADTVTVFIALMLLGRWLRERMVQRNRKFLLEDRGLEQLTATVLREGPTLVACTELAVGDVLMLRPGDLFPVRVELLTPGAISLDWIDGESEPHPHQPGDEIPAGAFNVSRKALQARVIEPFEESNVVKLLRQSTSFDAAADAWWTRVAAVWVLVVLVLGAASFALWWSHGWEQALSVTTAVLVVTCPCAFGIAVPLAYELAHAQLRRRGVFVRSASLLDRLREVRQIVFDKTGTLTTGRLRLVDVAVLRTLAPGERQILAGLALASHHPKSRAVAEALEGIAPRALDVESHPGAGVEATCDGVVYRLGSARWVGATSGDLVFQGREGYLALDTEEDLRPAARTELDALKTRGMKTWILSGDLQPRVDRIAHELGVAVERALGERSPEAKAEFVESHEPGLTLMIGDGLNDRLAADVALCSATPAVDRPFMASRCDFYFTTPGLSAITDALDVAHSLRRRVGNVLRFSVLYNVVAAILALMGWMQPWIAAVLMPLSSISVLFYVSASARKAQTQRSNWRPAWKF